MKGNDRQLSLFANYAELNETWENALKQNWGDDDAGGIATVSCEYNSDKKNFFIFHGVSFLAFASPTMYLNCVHNFLPSSAFSYLPFLFVGAFSLPALKLEGSQTTNSASIKDLMLAA